MNSSSGMSNMAKLGFKAKEICDILDACAKAGVKNFTCGELEIKFDEPPTVIEHKPHSLDDFDSQLSLVDQNEIADDILESQMLIDDPSGFEQAQIARCFQDTAESNE